MDDAKLSDEAGRLAALRRYQVLDTGPEAPFENITSLVKNVLSVPIAAVSLIDTDRQWFKSINGLDAAETTRSVAFCAHTIKRREAMLVPDAQKDRTFAENPLVTGEPFIRSYAGAPLETPDGYNLGALCAIDLVPREFAEGQVEVLRSFAKLVVDELELRLIASTDPLTGAHSRRAWIEAVDKEISRSRRYGSPASIALLDLDKFKAINDTHGHPAGDAVLSAVGRICAETVRGSDSFGRIGGEEFALLMPEASQSQAVDSAERLREKIAATPIRFGDASLNVTVSIGISTLCDRHGDPQSWMADADRALYRAKDAGRNRTEIATASEADTLAV